VVKAITQESVTLQTAGHEWNILFASEEAPVQPKS
jgi:hypothetical protein